MIYANEGIDNRMDEMIEMINEAKLIDIYVKVDPLNEVNTYKRGMQRIDYVFVTK